jgi:hypothetical protein
MTSSSKKKFRSSADHHGQKIQTDRQSSFIENSIEAGILQSGKGAIHASVGFTPQWQHVQQVMEISSSTSMITHSVTTTSKPCNP